MVGFIPPAEGVIDLTVSEDGDHEDGTTEPVEIEGGRDGRIGQSVTSLPVTQPGQGVQASRQQPHIMATPSKRASTILLNDESPVPNSNTAGVHLTGAAASPSLYSRSTKVFYLGL